MEFSLHKYSANIKKERTFSFQSPGVPTWMRRRQARLLATGEKEFGWWRNELKCEPSHDQTTSFRDSARRDYKLLRSRQSNLLDVGRHAIWIRKLARGKNGAQVVIDGFTSPREWAIRYGFANQDIFSSSTRTAILQSVYEGFLLQRGPLFCESN